MGPGGTRADEMRHGRDPISHGAYPPLTLAQILINNYYYLDLLYSKSNYGYYYYYCLLLHSVSVSEMTTAWLCPLLTVKPIYFPSGVLLLLHFS